MKLVQSIAAASLLASLSSVSQALPVQPADNTLDQCQQRFGSSGQDTYVFGFLPLQGDVFHGKVTIGERQQKDEVSALTPFTSGSLEYFLRKDLKTFDLKLQPVNRPQDVSACEDYVSEAGPNMEVVQLNWNGNPPMNAMTTWSLRYHSFGPLSCYLGAEPGNAEIVLMCKVHIGKTLVYPYQLIEELKTLFTDSKVVDAVCQSLGDEARSGTEAACRKNINGLKVLGLEPLHYLPLQHINAHESVLK